MVEVSVYDNRGVANSTFKDILISPNNDDVIIPISTTFDKAVLHIGIGNGCGIFIEKFGMKNGKELKTSVKYATRKFTDDRQQRRNKGKDRKASKSEDIEKIVDESGEKFMRDIPSMKKKDRQMARQFDHLLAQAPTENNRGIDTISDTKPLKESKSVDTESDISVTDESIQSIIGTVLTSDMKNDVHGKHMNDKEIARITAPSFDNQILVGPNINTHLYKLNETRFNAEGTTSFEDIGKAYQEEMLQITFEKETGVSKPNHIRPSNETGFPLEDDMHIYLDEIFVISKRGTQMFDEFVSATKEMRTNDTRLEDVPESESTSAIVDIDKGNTEENTNLFGVVLGPNSCDTFVDRAADNDSDTLDDIGPDTFGDFLDKESDDSMSKEKGDRQMAWLFDHLLAQAPMENKSGIDTISDTKPLKESKSVDTESDISVTDESIQSIIGTVLTSDIRNDVQGKPMNDKEIARITAPSFDNQILVGPNMNIQFYKLNETRFNAEGTTSFEAIDKAYQEEMLQISFEKEAGVYKPNHIRPSNETGFPLEDDMHIYLDEIFVISKRGTQMFDEFVSATKEMRTNDKRLEDVPESESTSAIVDIDKGNAEENSNLFGVVLGPISCDTFVDRAADNDSDTLDDIGPDTFGDFLDKESDDSMSKEKGDRQMTWLFDHLLAQAPTENKSGIDTISDTKPLKESKSVDTESDIGATDESIQSIIGTILTSDMKNDVHGKHMNDKEIARITAPSFDNQILVGPNINTHLYKLNETRFNAEGTTSFEDIGKAYQEEMLQITFEKEAGVYKPNHIRPSNETGFPLEDDMHIYLDEIFVISKRGTQMFDEFVSATKEMRTNDKRLEDVPESESTSAIVVIDKGNTEENTNLFGVVLGPISCDTFVDRAADNDSDTLDDIGPDTFDDFLDKESDDSMSKEKSDRQMAWLFDHLLAQAPTENKSGIDTISDTKPLKESKSVDTESDIGATDESIQSIIGTVLTSDMKNDVHGKHMNDKEIARITAPSFDNQILVGPNINTHLYKLNETRFNAEGTTSFEDIGKAYQEEMLQITFEKETGVSKPNHIRPSNETGFPLEDDMHIYLDEIFVISKRGTQMFDEFVSATKEMRTKDKQLEDVPESKPTSAFVDIDKGNTDEDSNFFGDVLDKDQRGPIPCDTFIDRAADNDSDTLDDIGPDTFGDFLDKESDDSMSKEKGAVDETSESDTLDCILNIESDDEIVDIIEANDDIVDIEAIALQDQNIVDITAARHDINYTYNTYSDIVKASKSEDIKKIVDESVEKFIREIPSMKKIDRQMARLFDHLLAQAPTENKSGIDTISDTKPLKESKSVDTESDIGATDESIQSIIEPVLTSDMKNDVHGKHMNDKEIARITAPSFDNQILVGPNMNTHLYKLNETRFNAEGTTSFEDIGKAYQEEMLQITFEKEAGVSKPNHIRPSNETGFPLEDDMHIYLDEIFVISKRGTQMFDEFVSATKEMRTKDKQLEDVPESKPTSAFVDIDTGNTEEDSNFFGDVLDKDQRGPISCDTFIDRAADNDSDTLDDIGPDTFSDFLDKESDDSMSKEKGAVDETSESDTLDVILNIESDDEIVDIIEANDDIADIEAIALQDQDIVDITAARNDTDDTYITYSDVVDGDDNLFGIMSIYIKSDLHFDLHNISASAEHCD